MKSKRTLRKISIFSISMVSMLTLTLSNSRFIHESNPEELGLDSNISKESRRVTDNHRISKYNVSQTSKGANSVTYTINYAEDGVWFWDISKDDYNTKKWTKYASDAWYYGPEVDIDDLGSDSWHAGQSAYAPEFTIKYTGDRPSHKEWQPGGDGYLGYEHGGPGWAGGSRPTEPQKPDKNDDNYDDLYAQWEIDHANWEVQAQNWDDKHDEWEGRGDDDYEIDVYDSWPNPASNAFSGGYYGFTQLTSYSSSSNIEYTYQWNQYNSEMKSFPDLNKHWTYTSKDEGQWNQSTYDHWNWTGNPWWDTPDRRETGEANEKVYVDWYIESVGWSDSGSEVIDTTDVVTQTASQFAASQDLHTELYNPTEKEKQSSTAPTITIDEPEDSDWFGVSGSKTFTISNLTSGWTYDVHMDLNYDDKDGVAHTFKTFDEVVSFEKTNTSSVHTWSESDNPDSIKFGYDVDDKNHLRVSNVRWKFVSDTGREVVGESQSSHFAKTFDLVEGESSASFYAEYDYSLSTDASGRPSAPKVAYDDLSSVEPGNYYVDLIEDFDIWVENIQQNDFVFNYYIATNNNHLPEGSKIAIQGPGGFNVEIDDIKLGTTSYLVDTTGIDPIDGDIHAQLILPPEYYSEDQDLEILDSTTHINNETNLIKDYSLRVVQAEEIRDHEATIEFEMDRISKLPEEPTSIQYCLNDEWYDLEFEDTTDPQVIELENLYDNYEYEFKIRVTSNSIDYTSNTFKFKTDRSTNIYVDTTFDNFDNPELNDEYSSFTIGEHSASFTFEVDKYEYIDNPEFTWGIKDKETKEIVYENKEVITHNGETTLFADGLMTNHEYEFVVNIEVEGEVLLLTKNFNTLIERSLDDTLNTSFITDVEHKSNTYTLQTEGNVQSVQYSTDDGKTWIDSTSWSINGDGKVVVRDAKTNELGKVSFMLNYQYRSQSTYYDGIETTMIVPKDPIEINWLLLSIILAIVFIIITITLAWLWGYKYRNNEETRKIDGNIWRSKE